MLLYGKDSSRGFRSLRGYRFLNCLCGEVPSQTHYSYLLYAISSIAYCTYLYVHALLVYTRIFHPNLPMLGQQHSGGNILPFYTPIQDSRIRSIALLLGLSILDKQEQ